MVGFMLGKSIEFHQIDYYLDFRRRKMKPKDDGTPPLDEERELATAQPNTFPQSVKRLLN